MTLPARKSSAPPALPVARRPARIWRRIEEVAAKLRRHVGLTVEEAAWDATRAVEQEEIRFRDGRADRYEARRIKRRRELAEEQRLYELARGAALMAAAELAEAVKKSNDPKVRLALARYKVLARKAKAA